MSEIYMVMERTWEENHGSAGGMHEVETIRDIYSKEDDANSALAEFKKLFPYGVFFIEPKSVLDSFTPYTGPTFR